MTYRDAGWISTPVMPGRGDQALAKSTRAVRQRCRAWRIWRLLRPPRRRFWGPHSGFHHRWRRHQAENCHRGEEARQDRHRSGRHVRQRLGGAGRRAAVVPRLFRHRQNLTSPSADRSWPASPTVQTGGLCAGRRRDRGNAGHVCGGRLRSAGFAVARWNADRRSPALRWPRGDVVLGLASSGVHSNGYSLVRKVVELNACL